MSLKIIKESKQLQLDDTKEIELFFEDLSVVIKMINNTEGSKLLSVDSTTKGMMIEFTIKYSIEHEE